MGDGAAFGEATAAASSSPVASDLRRKRQTGCGACDNCGAGLHLPPGAIKDSQAGPSAAELVLAALVEQSWGRRTLIRLLRGDPETPERARESAAFGCLVERSEQSLGQLLDSLIAEGLIAPRTLEHGGVTLEATRAGVGSLKLQPAAGWPKGAAAKGAPKPRTAHARWHKS